MNAGGDEKKTSRGEARRGAVLKAAAALFLENGFEKTTLDMVIARAGGSRRTVYQEFGNKEGLFGAVITHRVRKILDAFNEFEAGSHSPEQTLTGFARRFITLMISDDFMRLYRVLAAEIPRFPELGRVFYDHGPAVSKRTLATYLRRQTDAGNLAVENPEEQAVLFLGMVRGGPHLKALVQPGWTPEPGEIDAHIALAVKTFLNGVGRRK